MNTKKYIEEQAKEFGRKVISIAEGYDSRTWLYGIWSLFKSFYEAIISSAENTEKDKLAKIWEHQKKQIDELFEN